MPEPAYDYAVIRIVPRVDREEFVNAGVIVFCPALGYLGCKVEVPETRLRALAPTLELGPVRRHLEAFVEICEGDPGGGPIAALPLNERFHWLVHPRSTSLQTSPVHAGCTADPAKTLQHLFETLVSC